FRDGADNKWSTFFVNIGTPAQTVRLLPGTSANAGAIWAVLEEGCTIVNPNLDLSSCKQSRGDLFQHNESTSWSIQGLENDGIFSLPTYEESLLDLGDNASYGFDSISLGLNSGLGSIQHTLIAGLVNNKYWVGSLGLSPFGVNFTNFVDPQPSLLSTLFNRSVIPSLSWAYTAGAYYRGQDSFGSLTLGGYDTTRFVDNGVSFPFGADQSRDLLVSLTSITYDSLGSSPLLTQAINIFIDSMVSHLWLPLETCHAFEQAFNLTWDSTYELYLLDNDTHNSLLAQNASFKFNLTNGSSPISTSNSVQIVLPYAAFDLTIEPPYVESEQKYFPLKRAQDPSQYTLGRVFLQEAYVVADYDRHNFSVSQTVFPGRGVSQDLVPIYPPESESHKKGNRKLSTGAIAGIAIAGVALLATILGFLAWRLIRRRRQHSEPVIVSSSTTTNYPTNKKDAHTEENPSWINDSKTRHEIQGVDPHELFARGPSVGMPELEVPNKVHEIDGRAGPVVELEA
ncbi:acid protease, partial [Aureobasidium melanogenum CBS 110374]